MNYELLLEGAYERVKQTECSDRFEILKVKGHHEGTKTIITNFTQVISQMRRPAQHFMKFLGKELASPTEVSGDRLILSRRLSSKEVNEKIQKYVNNFVMCKNCKKPDTELEIGSSSCTVKCLACGAKTQVHKI